jgi:hypothetical protein
MTVMLRPSHSRRRWGWRLLLLLVISVCVASIIDFGYRAYQKAYSSDVSPISDFIGRSTRLGAGSFEYGYDDVYMAADAIIALLALPVVLGTSVKLSKIPRRRKRLVLGTEAVVVTLLVVAALQWTLWERSEVLKKKFWESKDESGAEPYDFTPHANWPPEMTIAGDKLP